MRSHGRGIERGVVLVALWSACGGGAASSSPAETPANQGETMSLDDFAAASAQGAAPQLCGAPDAPLRACFELEGEQCVAAFTAAMRGCADAMRADLPATVDGGNADATARTIAECAGQAYRMAAEQNGLVRQTPECQAPPNG